MYLLWLQAWFQSQNGEERKKVVAKILFSQWRRKNAKKIVAKIQFSQWRKKNAKTCCHDFILTVEKNAKKLLTWLHSHSGEEDYKIVANMILPYYTLEKRNAKLLPYWLIPISQSRKRLQELLPWKFPVSFKSGARLQNHCHENNSNLIVKKNPKLS